MTHRLHVIGLPYLPTSRAYPACAFTARAEKFCEQMTAQGNEVHHYGVEGSDVVCTSHTDVFSQAERRSFFDGYDTVKVCYAERPVVWDENHASWQTFNAKAAHAISRKLRRGDFICVIGGRCQKQIVSVLAPQAHLFQAVEFGIGYLGTFAARRVFDSYAHMHHVYGRESGNLPHGRDGENYDAVIPMPYRVEEFKVGQPDGYYLYLGRVTQRKGVRTAVEATRRASVRLVIAGQGVANVKGCKITADDGEVYEGEHLRYVGHVYQAQKVALLSRANAVLVPSTYIEPLGGVNIEAQLCGAPVITTDFGAFPETVEHGVSGYRCRTLEQFVWAIDAVRNLYREVIAIRARSLWSMERVGRMYREYFDMLATLWGDGWYAVKNRTQLDWLKGGVV